MPLFTFRDDSSQLSNLQSSSSAALFRLARAARLRRIRPRECSLARLDSRATLFIVGGGSQPPELVRRFVSLAGGPGRARIVVMPMASGSTEAGQEKADDLRALGADAFVLNLTRAQAESDSVARLLDDVTGVWFSGGDQVLLAPVLLGTPVLEAIHRRYREGGRDRRNLRRSRGHVRLDDHRRADARRRGHRWLLWGRVPAGCTADHRHSARPGFSSERHRGSALFSSGSGTTGS